MAVLLRFYIVLVKALRLRRQGIRLLADELRCVEPMTGFLTVKEDAARRLVGRGSRMALLMPSSGSIDPLAQLHSARLLKIDKRGLVVQGIEDVWRRKACTDYRQAPWCWPIDASETAPREPRNAIDLEEEAMDLASALRR